MVLNEQIMDYVFSEFCLAGSKERKLQVLDTVFVYEGKSLENLKHDIPHCRLRKHASSGKMSGKALNPF